MNKRSPPRDPRDSAAKKGGHEIRRGMKIVRLAGQPTQLKNISGVINKPMKIAPLEGTVLPEHSQTGN